MNQRKSSFLIFTFFIFLFFGNINLLNSQSVCKINFCNCCGDSLHYDVYDFSGTWSGDFWTNKSGCTNVAGGIFNPTPGSTWRIVSECGNGIYFTACPCVDEGDWFDTVKVPCCGDDSRNSKIIDGKDKFNTHLIPKEFQLYQNFPNPFNPVTQIKFALPKSDFVKLSIYDITGKEVVVLVNKIMNLGYHEITWDASNASSGIYICKIETTNFSDEKKMVLLK